MKLKTDNRSMDRKVVSIPAVIRVQEDIDSYLEEPGKVIALTKNNVSLVVNRKCQIGHLLLISALFPKEMRCYDLIENIYHVWGIVQHCSSISGNEETENFHLGIALIGEKPPSSYIVNPMQNYRLCGCEDSGFWKIVEVEKEFKTRKNPRFKTSIEVYLGILDEKNNLVGGEKVLTENISASGVAVFSNLELKVGDCVKIINQKYDFSALAVVRNRDIFDNHQPKVHLEFVAATFPIHKLMF